MFYLIGIVFCPLLGALCIITLRNKTVQIIRGVALVFSSASLALTAVVAYQFVVNDPHMQFLFSWPWIPQIGVTFALGIDGISLVFLISTTLISFIALCASTHIQQRAAEYFCYFLLLETGLCGIVSALDFFLLYVFLNSAIIALYFLIGIWGGADRERAAITFFIYLFFSSLLLLVGMIGLYFYTGAHTFDLLLLVEKSNQLQGTHAMVLFSLLVVGFSLIMPIVPFHSWFTRAVHQAPIPVAIMIVALFSKAGLYGLVRVVLPMLSKTFQEVSFLLIIVSMVTVLYSVLLCMSQKDMRRIIAFSSLMHIGFCYAGIASLSTTGWNGAILHIFNQSIFITALFLLALVIQKRSNTLDIDHLSGLSHTMPVFTGLMIIAILALNGLPGLSGFVGILLCVLGIFTAYPEATILIIVGALINAGFCMNIFGRLFLGNKNEQLQQYTDITVREQIIVIPLLIIILILGIYPKVLLDIINVPVVAVLGMLP